MGLLTKKDVKKEFIRIITNNYNFKNKEHILYAEKQIHAFCKKHINVKSKYFYYFLTESKSSNSFYITLECVQENINWEKSIRISDHWDWYTNAGNYSKNTNHKQFVGIGIKLETESWYKQPYHVVSLHPKTLQKSINKHKK